MLPLLADVASTGFSFHNLLEAVTPEIISIIEIIGILIITIGSFKAFYKYLIAMFTGRHFPIKIELGNALALGLEFKMGAEILKTVLIRDINEIYVLGAIIILRAFLALLIHFEVKQELAHGHHELEETVSPNNY